MTPSRRSTVALAAVAALLLTVPVMAAPAADAGTVPAFDRLATLWSQLWTGIDRLLPAGEAGSDLERAAGGSGALLNPDGYAPPSDEGDASGALLDPDGEASGALLNPDG